MVVVHVGYSLGAIDGDGSHDFRYEDVAIANFHSGMDGTMLPAEVVMVYDKDTPASAWMLNFLSLEP